MRNNQHVQSSVPSIKSEPISTRRFGVRSSQTTLCKFISSLGKLRFALPQPMLDHDLHRRIFLTQCRHSRFCIKSMRGGRIRYSDRILVEFVNSRRWKSAPPIIDVILCSGSENPDRAIGERADVTWTNETSAGVAAR